MQHIIETESSKFVIEAQHPDNDDDYKVAKYDKGSEIEGTRPSGIMYLTEKEIKLFSSMSRPNYPMCDCGNPADFSGECAYCKHGVEQ